MTEATDYTADELIVELNKVSEKVHERFTSARGPAGWAASQAMARLQEAQMWVVNAISAQDQMDALVEAAAVKAAASGAPALTVEGGGQK